MTEEIKSVARRHLATDGANLSLRAVARDMGMASSAVYRYFPSRDELLTALIIEAYDALGDAAERAAAASDDPVERWLGVAHAAREWALAEPHQWALVYGSPVPGYQAPQDTIGPATRLVLQLARIVADAHAAGRITERPPITGRYAEELAAVAAAFGEHTSARVVGATMSGFTHLIGAISAELFGQLNKSVEDDRRGFFDFQMRGAADFVGLR